MMSSEAPELNEQENIHGKHLHNLDISSWKANVGESKFGMSGNKEGNIWNQSEVSNVWGVMPVTGSTWGRNDSYSMFQGISGDKTESLKNYGNSGWDNADSVDQLGGKSFAISGSADVWRGFQEYDPFKRSWGEVDFTASSNNADKANWNSAPKDSDKQADIHQQKSVGQIVHKSASMSEISLTMQSGEVQSSMTEASPLPPSLPFKSVSSGDFSTDPSTKPESERSQPDGAEVSQQNKEEIIAKMVNSHDGWGKKPIRQDTPWQTDSSAPIQPQQAPLDANPATGAPANAIGSEVPKTDLSNMWNINDPLSGGGSTSWNTSFFSSSSVPFSGSNADWISDGDIGIWSGPPPSGCEMANPNLWTGPPKDGPSIHQSSMWSSNPPSSGWPNDLSIDRNPWGNDAALGQFWNGPPKTPDEFLGQKKGLLPGQHSTAMYGGQNMKPIGMWGDNSSVQTETGYWNQPNLMIKDDLRQALSGSNHLAAEKILSMINSGGRLMKENVDPPRGRMLRGKSVIETSDYNQSFSNLQRGGNFSTSAFQPPQHLYNQQQLQQQLLLQKAGLLGGFQHGRSASHIPKMDSLSGALGSGMGLNQSIGSAPKSVNLIQNCLQLQSILQPLLVERSQLQQNKIIPLAQKKIRLDALNQDIAKVKAYIDGLQVMNGGASQSLGSTFNQSDLGLLDEARLRQALNQPKLDPYNSSNFPLGSLFGLGGGSNNTANDLAALLQNVNISGNPNLMNNWLPNMMPNVPGGDTGGFLQGGQQQDSWTSYLGKQSSFGAVPPPPPGLGPADKMAGGSLMGQQGFFSRSTSWAPGEKSKSGYSGNSTTNWLLIKNTSSIEPHLLHSICGQCGTLQQLLSNKLTGHSLACFKDDFHSVQNKLQQIGNLASDFLSSQDVFNLFDANGCGGVAAAWVNVSASTASPSVTSTSSTMVPPTSSSNGAGGVAPGGTSE